MGSLPIQTIKSVIKLNQKPYKKDQLVMERQNRSVRMDKTLKEIIDEAKNVVFFGGAGVSTESGIPDFRSKDGLYHAQQSYGYPPETILSHTFYVNHNETFFKYYKENLIAKDVQPNKAHKALAELERRGKLKAVITQNIDGLHQKAGSVNVLELHGSTLRNTDRKSVV